MKKLLVVLLLVMCAGTLAFADQVTINFVLGQSGNPAGPYLFDVTPFPAGTPTTQQFLVCWSDFNPVPTGQVYDVFTIANVPTPGPFNETLDQYKEIAWLSAIMLANGAGNPANADLQVAVWLVAGLFNNSLPDTPGADALVIAAANAVAQGYDAAGAVFYINANSSKGNGPQPLVGFVPEPGSLMLLGTGILGVAGAIRRRLV